MRTRADRHRNPAAITTDVAAQAGLTLKIDYEVGEPFTWKGTDGKTHTAYTALFLGDPLAITLRVIDAIGYTTSHGAQRWTYINIPAPIWKTFTDEQRKATVAFHYRNEGGTEMTALFA